MKRLPSLKQMEYLVALSETTHFGQAAVQCNITPSTLSAGIRDLESVLGVPLAERTKRHVLMTPIGNGIAERARRILHDAEDIMEVAAGNRQPMTGDMRLGVIPTISPFLLPRVLPPLSRHFPRLRLVLLEDKTADLLTRLRAGEIDVALIALPFDTEGLASTVLFEDQFQFACNRKHLLARKTFIAPADFAEQPLMLLEEGHCLRGHALSACQLVEKQTRAQFEASSLHTLVQMVAAGMGVTLLPELAIKSQITRGTSIKLIPLATPTARQIGLVWRQSSLRSEEYGILADELRRLATD